MFAPKFNNFTVRRQIHSDMPHRLFFFFKLSADSELHLKLKYVKEKHIGMQYMQCVLCARSVCSKHYVFDIIQGNLSTSFLPLDTLLHCCIILTLVPFKQIVFPFIWACVCVCSCTCYSWNHTAPGPLSRENETPLYRLRPWTLPQTPTLQRKRERAGWKREISLWNKGNTK